MTTLSSSNPPDFAAMQAAVRERLAGLGWRLRRRVVFLGIARALAVLVAMLVLSLLLDRWLELGRLGRAVYWLVTAAAGAHLVYHDAVRPSLVRLSPVQVAAAWDRAARPASPLAPRVATVLEMPARAGGAEAPSAGMVERAVRSSHEAVGQADLAAALDPRPVRRAAGWLAVAAGLALLITLVWPATVGLWAQRWLAFSNQPWPRSTTLELAGVHDGTLTVPRGEPFEVRVRATDTDEPTRAVRLTLDPQGDADGEARHATVERTGDGRAATPATAAAAGSGSGSGSGGGAEFRHSFAPLQNDAGLTVTGGDAALGPVTVRPVDRPRLVGLTLTATHPRHPDDPPLVHELTGERGDTALLPHTAATLRLAANVAVESLRATNGQLPAEPRRVDDRTFELGWSHTGTVRFDVELVAAESDLVSYPLPVTVRLRGDQAPTVTLVSSGVRQRVTPNALVPLGITARDDHGLQRVNLDATLAASAPPPTPAPGAEPSTRTIDTMPLYRADGEARAVFDTTLDFDLAERGAAPGDVLTLVATAVDDGYAGPQEAPSRRLTFRVVTRDELFREVLLRQQGLRQQFRQAATEAQAIADALTLAESPAVGGGVRGRFAAVQRQVWSVSRGLHDTAEEMRLNRLAGEEAFELMKENVLDPLTTLHDESLAAQRRRIEALAGPDATADELATARQEQAALVATMENILRQMDQFDSFIDVVNQLNEVLNLQRGVLNSTRAMSEEKRDALFDD